MSLVSASGFVGGIKEYVYRGIQQLPIVLASTSLVYTVATGSMAHLNLFAGLGVLMPIYTFLLQCLVQFIMNFVAKDTIFWKRASGDTCNLVPSGKQETLSYYTSDPKGGGAVPSYWLMSIGFFIGYSISNAVDSLLTPAVAGANSVNHEKRNTQAIFIIVATSIFSVLIIGMRLFYMRGCEGTGWGGVAMSLVAATGAAAIGQGMYKFSRTCGARSSDLFGVLSQILPASASSPHPVVCTAN